MGLGIGNWECVIFCWHDVWPWPQAFDTLVEDEEKQEMKEQQEQDKEIQEIEQSYDAGEERLDISVWVNDIFFSPGRLPRPRFVMLGQQGVGKILKVCALK